MVCDGLRNIDFNDINENKELSLEHIQKFRYLKIY